MIKNRTNLVLLFATLLCSTFGYAGKNVPIAPINGTVISVTVKGDEKNYYALPKAKPLRIKVDGPASLETLTRLSMPKGNASMEKYSIKVTEGTQLVKLYSTSTERSDASYKNSHYVPGKSRKFTIDVPNGTHTYVYQLDDCNADEAAVRFSIRSKGGTPGTRGSALEPLSYDKVVTAIVSENLITYYVSSKEKYVNLRVIGPTRLQIISRLNFEPAMKGEQSYLLSIWEGNDKVLMKPLSTTKSLGINYEEWKDVVPGKVDKIYLDVPKGEHMYKFRLEETVAHSVSLKFSIPKKDLGNEG